MPELPHQDVLDAFEGELARVSQALDAVHLLTFRAGLTRQLLGAEHRREEAERRLAKLAADWPGRLDDLEAALKRLRSKTTEVRRAPADSG